nr:integrase, catalytic region, zinc finger, CCHC-type, peptidase aspartic, catalytic [Tanacetum cinerariifolium]
MAGPVAGNQIARSRMREEVQTFKNLLGQLTALIAELEAAPVPDKVFNTLMCLKDDVRDEQTRLDALNGCITQAEEQIKIKEEHICVIESEANDARVYYLESMVLGIVCGCYRLVFGEGSLMYNLCSALRVSLSNKRRLVVESEELGELKGTTKSLEHIRVIVGRDAVTLEELEALWAHAQVGSVVEDNRFARQINRVVAVVYNVVVGIVAYSLTVCFVLPPGRSSEAIPDSHEKIGSSEAIPDSHEKIGPRVKVLCGEEWWRSWGRCGKLKRVREMGWGLCYPKNDREDIGKLGAKGDIGFFIGYSADSCAYRIYNRRTKKIIETMNVSFDELSAMDFEQCSSKPRLQRMTSGQITMYDDYISGQPSATARTVPPAHEPQDVDELNPNALFDGNTFVNPFANSSTSAAESSSSQNVDPSNMHTFYQPYPHKFQWTKDHPLEQVIREPSRPVFTRNQL